MTDLSRTIAPKSDQLNADDLISGPRTLTITGVSACPDSMEQPIAVNFEGDNGKPFKPCKSMRRVMVSVWGPDGASYVGRSMTIYRDPSVKFGGMEVGGIRISHMSGIEKPVVMALTTMRAKRAPFTVQPLKIDRGPDPEVIIAAAKAAAGEGIEKFRAYWNTAEAKASREILKPHIKEFQDLAAAADAAAYHEEADPFGLPNLPDDESAPDLAPATASLIDKIRSDLEGGADVADCMAMYGEEIADAKKRDPASALIFDELLG